MLLQTGKDLLVTTSNICSCLHTCGNVTEVSLRKICCMPQHISDVNFYVGSPKVPRQTTVRESCVQDLPSHDFSHYGRLWVFIAKQEYLELGVSPIWHLCSMPSQHESRSFCLYTRICPHGNCTQPLYTMKNTLLCLCSKGEYAAILLLFSILLKSSFVIDNANI